ncbi:MAG: hypothetical protein EKK63_10215 [Acinetobacter sp.]|uniref:class II glutamine amidotransferase n=1 Tax=Acinetobacter sp. TaxID=472 RepID=UPI000FA43772|nr:class II glutamine amidotransferase [Acinetobacter sp.]RUP39363.1 MAG: hypothetical protein EKK63_10215 [Acinetobacter sp.]
MCVIIQLKPNFTPTYEKIKNAVLNNRDGWGLVVKDRGRLSVRRECPEKGNDPDVIYQALLDGVSQERFLHVRFNTVGKTNLDNCHPFTVMNDGKGKARIEFMHNGTIHKYKPGQSLTDWSDSRNYAYTFMFNLLNKFKGENGLGDYHDPFFSTLIGDTFGNMNRGLLISSKFNPLRLGNWSTIVDGGDSFFASNDDYFRTAMSGRDRYTPAKTVSSGSSSSPPSSRVQSDSSVAKEATTGNKEVISKLADINLKKRPARVLVTQDFQHLMSWGKECPLDDLDDEDLSYFVYTTKKEWEQFMISDVDASSALLEYIFVRFHNLVEEFKNADDERFKAVEKHEKATNAMQVMAFNVGEKNGKIAELEKTIANLRAEIVELEKSKAA